MQQWKGEIYTLIDREENDSWNFYLDWRVKIRLLDWKEERNKTGVMRLAAIITKRWVKRHKIEWQQNKWKTKVRFAHLLSLFLSLLVKDVNEACSLLRRFECAENLNSGSVENFTIPSIFIEFQLKILDWEISRYFPRIFCQILSSVCQTEDFPFSTLQIPTFPKITSYFTSSNGYFN